MLTKLNKLLGCTALTFLCLTATQDLLAQRKHSCGATEVNEKRRQTGSLPQKAAFEKWISQHIKDLQVARTEDGTDKYIVPIVYHIVHTGQPVGTGYNIPYAQVVSQNRVINEDFNRTNADTTLTPAVFRNRGAGFGIEFRLAEIDPQGNRLAEPGVVRHNISGLGLDEKSLLSEDIDKKIAPSRVFPPNFAINQFVVPSAAFPPDEPGGKPTVLYGYATFPGDSGNGGDTNPSDVPLSVTTVNAFGSARDGIRGLDSNADRGRTTTHELGHYFALFHIWGDEDACEADDYCEDTPKQAKSNQGSSECGKVQLSCDGVTQEMRQNYMDYTDDECLNMFTNDQKKRFLAVMKNSKTRKDLPFSEAIKPHAAPSNLSATSGTGATNVEIKWKDNSTNESGYVLERSSNGQTFTEISKPANNTTSFVDNGLSAGTKYSYRIKATNRAGETGYSNVAEVTVGSGSADPLSAEDNLLQQALQISPNPNAGTFLVSLQIPYRSEVKITVTDLTGRTVGQWTSAKTTNLKQEIELNQFAQGLYVLHIQTERGYASQKIVVQK
jgi:hypothetical protein